MAETVHLEDNVKKQKKKKRRTVRRKILTVLAVLILIGAGLLVWLRLKSEYTIVYQEYTASIGSISNSLSFSGTMQAVSNASYTASSTTTVRTVYVSEGDDVKAGDKLIRLTSGQTIDAEFDGRVNQLYVAQGDKVVSGDTIIQVVDFSHMKVSIRVDEYDISDVHVGTACRVTTTATDETFPCEIASINYVSSSTGNVAYYTATAYVDVSGTVYPGMQVTVTVPQEEASNVVILKADAISFDRSNHAFVYRQDESGQMVESMITTGVSNGNYVEITQGLNGGDVVYAVAKETETTSANLLSSLFGGQMVMPNSAPGGNRNYGQQNFNRNTQNTNTNRNPGGGGASR